MSDLRKCTHLVKRSLQSEDWGKACVQMTCLLPLLNEYIDLCQGKEKVETKPVIKGFRLISKFVRSPCLDKIFTTSEYPNFPNLVRKIMINASSLRGSNDCFFLLWKRSVVIATFLLNSSVIHLWHEPLERMFLAGLTNLDSQESINILATRFHYLAENIAIRQPSVQILWWEIISSVLLCMFVPYPVITLDGAVIPRKCVEGRCPESVKQDVIALFNNPNLCFVCTLKKESPNEITSLMYFLVQSRDDDADDIVIWFVEMWAPLVSSNRRKTAAFGLLELYALLCPQCIINLMQLVTRCAMIGVVRARSAKKKNMNREFHMFSLLQAIWSKTIRDLDVPSLLPKMLFSMMAELSEPLPLMEIVIFFAFTFDYKLCDSVVWEFFKRRTDRFSDDELSVCEKMLSVLAVNFAPLFFQFTYDEVSAYVAKEVQRQSRLRQASQEDGDSEVKKAIDIFDNPWNFSGMIINDAALEEACHRMESDNDVKFLEISSRDWTLEEAKMYLDSILGAFSAKNRARLSARFFAALSAVQDLFPKYMIRSSESILTMFFEPALIHMLENECDMGIFRALVVSIAHLGIHQDPTPTHILWLETVLKFICSKNRMIMVAAALPSVKSIPQLAPSSYFLLPFLVNLVTDKHLVLTKGSLMNLIMTSFAVSISQRDFIPPDNLDDMSQRWSKEEIDFDFLNKCMAILKQQSSEKFNEMVCSIVPDNGLSFGTLMTLLAEDLLSDNEKVNPWLMEQAEKVIANAPPSITVIRMLTFIVQIIDQVAAKMPSLVEMFCSLVVKLLPDLSHNMHWLATEAVAALGRYSPQSIRKLLQPVNYLHPILIQHISYTLYKKVAPDMPPEEAPTVLIQTRSNCIFTIRKCFDGFDLFARSSGSYMSYHVTQMRVSSKFCKGEIPPVPDTEQQMQKAECSALDSLLHGIFGECEIPSVSEHKASKLKQKKLKQPKTRGIKPSEPLVYKNAEFKDLYVRLSDNHTVWSFFSQFYDIQEGTLQYRENNQSLYRKMNPIYKCNYRDQVKIGVLYVKEGQFEQHDILSNTKESTSLIFRQFLRAIGEVVDLKTHKWFDGKLNKSDKYSLFYENEQVEVMFHVSTMLPDDPNDQQKLAKKRHIGNDHVHIVWCENTTGYDPNVITSQFNDAHVIIYPCDNDIFRVIVNRKNQEYVFGPLIEDSMVTAKALPFLVLSTAITADRVIRGEVEKLPLDLYRSAIEAVTGQ